MAFIERRPFSPNNEHASRPERGLEQLAKDLDVAEERVQTTFSYVEGLRAQLALWKETLQETDASLSSPDAKQLLEHTKQLHELYRHAIREYTAATKELDALNQAHGAVDEVNVFGSSEIGEA